MGKTSIRDKRVVKEEFYELRHCAQVSESSIRHCRFTNAEAFKARASGQMSQPHIRDGCVVKEEFSKLRQFIQVNQTRIRHRSVTQVQISKIRQSGQLLNLGSRYGCALQSDEGDPFENDEFLHAFLACKLLQPCRTGC